MKRKLFSIMMIAIFLMGSFIILSDNNYIDAKEVKKPAKKSVKKVKAEPLKKAKTYGKNSPLKVMWNKTHYVIKGAKCGCGKAGHYFRDKTTNKFKNYCPFCKKYGLLIYNKKKVPEGELTCKKCDYDACCYDGNDKSGKFRKKVPRW